MDYLPESRTPARALAIAGSLLIIIGVIVGLIVADVFVPDSIEFPPQWIALAGVAALLLVAGAVTTAVSVRRRKGSRHPASDHEGAIDDGIIREADLAAAPSDVRAVLHRIFGSAASLRACRAHASGMLRGIDSEIDQVLYAAAERTAHAARLRTARGRLKSPAGPAGEDARQRIDVALDDVTRYLQGVESELKLAVNTALRMSAKIPAEVSAVTEIPIRVEDLVPANGLGPEATAADIAARIAALSAGYDEVCDVNSAVLHPEHRSAAPPAPPQENEPEQEAEQEPAAEPTPQRASRPRGLNRMKVVYLGDCPPAESDRGWLIALNGALARVGCQEIGDSQVIAPHYAPMLTAPGITAKMPEVTYRPGKDHLPSRRLFERRQTAVRQLLGPDPDVTAFGFTDTQALSPSRRRTARATADFTVVRQYLEDTGRRAAILHFLLQQVPTDGDILLIGHGLGGVIAIDLLDHLAADVRVRRFITIGAPADCGELHRDHERLLKNFPYARVDDWTNCFSGSDTAAMGRGLASMFAGAQDFAIKLGGGQDLADRYLTAPAVTTLISDILYPLDPIADAASAVGGRLTDDQFLTLLRLRFAAETAKHIKDGERAQRYTDALSIIQDDLAAQLRQLAEEGRELPTELHTIIAGHLPALPHRLKLRPAVALLVMLTATQLVEPHDIDTGDAWKQALIEVAVELGFQHETGSSIVRALTEVHDLLKRDGGIPWGQIGMAAAGVALLAAGPIGLMVAAPAGVAGGAAIVGGLAAFGPGGMAGGLGMLGGLAAGGAGLATGAALGGSSEEMFAHNATQLSLQVATNNAFKQLKLPIDQDLWGHLVTLETQTSAEINRLDAFSDPKSVRLQQLRATREIVQKLVRFVVDQRICC